MEETQKTVKGECISTKTWQLVMVGEPGECVGCIDDTLHSTMRIVGPAGNHVPL